MQNKRMNQSPINILVISPYFQPTIGGSQRYIEELYVNLVKRYPNIHVDVIAYNTERVAERENYRGLTIYRVPCIELIKGQFAMPNVFALWGLLLTLAKKRIAFVHTHIRFFDATWWAWIYAKIIGAKSIFTEQVASHPIHQNVWVSRIAKMVDMTIAAWSISRYDLITTTNEAAKLFLQRTLGIKKPITVSYGGVDTHYFHPKQTKHIPHLTTTLPKNAVVVTFASRLIWSKGITYFLDAVSTIKNLPTNVHIVIAGDGPLHGMVKERITRLPNKKRIHVVGGLNYHEMKQVLQATDIFIHPSHHNEGFPNVILEALASRCFVIATDNAGTKEVIKHLKNGFLIKQKSPSAIIEAVHIALDHTKKTRELAAQGRKDVVKRFDWSVVSTSFYLRLQQFCTFTITYAKSFTSLF